MSTNNQCTDNELMIKSQKSSKLDGGFSDWSFVGGVGVDLSHFGEGDTVPLIFDVHDELVEFFVAHEQFVLFVDEVLVLLSVVLEPVVELNFPNMVFGVFAEVFGQALDQFAWGFDLGALHSLCFQIYHQVVP